MNSLTPLPLCALTLLLLPLAACGSSNGGGDCTQMSCEDELTIDAVDDTGEPVLEFHGSVTVGDTTHEVTCTDDFEESITQDPEKNMQVGFSCEAGTLQIFDRLGDIDSVDVSLDAQTPGGDPYNSLVRTIPLDADTHYPNGPDCAGSCQRAQLTLTFVRQQDG